MNHEQQIIQLALAQARHLREAHGKPQIIGLSIYASDADLRLLRPEDGPNATAAQQRRITEAVAAALRADGTPVKLVTLRSAEYLTWLAATGMSNDASLRAQWINLQTAK
jgi:hypothetical protein